jgi:transposase
MYQLYVVENKTDIEIAKIYSVTKGTVGTWRRKHGIKGINAQHRSRIDNPPVPMSDRQRSIVLGTLLGDGCLKRQKTGTGYLSIAHSEKQKDYLFWLYSELESMCLSGPKSYTYKEKYVTWGFLTQTREDLTEIRDSIYTPKKVVNQWWLDQIDELALAIWYMDDGCLSYINKSRSEFTFATNGFSKDENYLLSDFLRSRFNIKSSVKVLNKKSGIQYNIIIDDDSFNDFTNLIEPHIIDSMRYKLPFSEHIERLKKNVKSEINEETLRDLYHIKMYTYDQIARILDVHKSTVRKYMDIFGIKPRGNSSAQLNGMNNSNKRDHLGRFKKLELSKAGEIRAQEIFDEMRKSDFPYFDVKSDEHYVGIIDTLCNKSVSPDDSGIHPYSRSGVNICSSLCPQIFSMASRRSKSPIEIFNDDEMLMDCIGRTLKYAKKDTIAAVRQGLKTYRKNRCVTIFPPLWTKSAIDHCFDEEGLSVLDFSCGFGGRLLGSYASGKVSHYLGIDPLSSNLNSNKEIRRLMQIHSDLSKREFHADFACSTAEDELPKIDRKFDLIITSPPYFSKEKYSDDESQCYLRYNKYEEWVEEWFRKVLQDSCNLLSDKGKMAIFASDTIDYNVGQDCKRLLQEISGEEPECLNFAQPTVEYLRKKKKKKLDTAWIAKK